MSCLFCPNTTACYKTCISKYGVTFHEIPPDKFISWSFVLYPVNKKNVTFKKGAGPFICSLHFDDWQFMIINKKVKTLKLDAYPKYSTYIEEKCLGDDRLAKERTLKRKALNVISIPVQNCSEKKNEFLETIVKPKKLEVLPCDVRITTQLEEHSAEMKTTYSKKTNVERKISPIAKGPNHNIPPLSIQHYAKPIASLAIRTLARIVNSRNFSLGTLNQCYYTRGNCALPHTTCFVSGCWNDSTVIDKWGRTMCPIIKEPQYLCGFCSKNPPFTFVDAFPLYNGYVDEKMCITHFIEASCSEVVLRNGDVFGPNGIRKKKSTTTVHTSEIMTKMLPTPIVTPATAVRKNMSTTQHRTPLIRQRMLATATPLVRRVNECYILRSAKSIPTMNEHDYSETVVGSPKKIIIVEPEQMFSPKEPTTTLLCTVNGCFADVSDPLTSSEFPTSPPLRKIWCSLIGKFIKDTDTICSQHFLPRKSSNGVEVPLLPTERLAINDNTVKQLVEDVRRFFCKPDDLTPQKYYCPTCCETFSFALELGRHEAQGSCHKPALTSNLSFHIKADEVKEDADADIPIFDETVECHDDSKKIKLDFDVKTEEDTLERLESVEIQNNQFSEFDSLLLPHTDVKIEPF